MKLVVALSGGIDSVVLLDMLVKTGKHNLVVAHFDHGMREDSAADARFSEGLALKHGLLFELGQGGLGALASEDAARSARYEFLFDVAEKYQARLVTAHHMDDTVETVALNIQRGTRWRGLAGMSDERILRPLQNRTKSELIEYALEEGLEWCEDETNLQDVYRRNIIRRQLSQFSSEQKHQIFELWQSQKLLRREIEREIRLGDFPIFSRYFMTMINESTARELLYSYVLDGFGISLLGGQLDQLLLAIKVGRPGTQWQVGSGLTIFVLGREWRAEGAE